MLKKRLCLVLDLIVSLSYIWIKIFDLICLYIYTIIYSQIFSSVRSINKVSGKVLSCNNCTWTIIKYVIQYFLELVNTFYTHSFKLVHAWRFHNKKHNLNNTRNKTLNKPIYFRKSKRVSSFEKKWIPKIFQNPNN